MAGPLKSKFVLFSAGFVGLFIFLFAREFARFERQFEKSNEVDPATTRQMTTNELEVSWTTLNIMIKNQTGQLIFLQHGAAFHFVGHLLRVFFIGPNQLSTTIVIQLLKFQFQRADRTSFSNDPEVILNVHFTSQSGSLYSFDVQGFDADPIVQHRQFQLVIK